MNYYNLTLPSETVSFKEATIRGQGKEKGLFFPEKTPSFSDHFINHIEDYNKEEIAFEVMQPFVGDNIPENALRQIVKETINFSVPLETITDTVSSLELFHGPTLAFKDVGARFMSRCLSYFLKDSHKQVTVLVATSGDTGGAVANGFYKVDGVDVCILYPKGRVSPVQEQQLTSLAGNITALEVNGSFDDCQALVKQAFANEELNKQIMLTSANSINVARWLPQQIYYLLAYKEWKQTNDDPPVICVPSGNFGNICAGILAWFRGMPVKHFIAACNANDTVPAYFKTQELNPKPSVATLSNAMDVSNPSNFIRVLELFDNKFSSLSEMVSATSISDEDTVETIQSVYKQTGYMLDPHGAVAYKALNDYLKRNENQKGYILETAHPVKFPAAVEEATNQTIDIPDDLQELMNRPKQSMKIEAEFEEVKQQLLQS